MHVNVFKDAIDQSLPMESSVLSIGLRGKYPFVRCFLLTISSLNKRRDLFYVNFFYVARRKSLLFYGISIGYTYRELLVLSNKHCLDCLFAVDCVSLSFSLYLSFLLSFGVVKFPVSINYRGPRRISLEIKNGLMASWNRTRVISFFILRGGIELEGTAFI